MANRRLAPAAIQPSAFAFTPENAAWAQGQIDKYPAGRQASAVISLLWRAQEQNGGWLPQKAIEAVAATLGMPVIRVLEVATFYTMFALEPVGRFWIQLCGTVPCDVCGAKGLKAALQARIGPPGHVTPDGNFSWIEVECLGACCNAPMVQINHDYYEDLTPESLNKLLDDLAAGRPVKPGPQNGRHASEPQDAIGTLSDATLFDGSRVGAWRARFAETHVDGAGVAQQDAPAPVEPKAAVPDKPAPVEPKAAASSAEAPVKPAAAEAVEAAADDRAVAEDRTLRSEPPQQPESSGADGNLVESRREGGSAGSPTLGSSPQEKERIRGIGTSELVAAYRHIAEREAGGPPAETEAGSQPLALDAPRDGKADDLKQINGIGPVNERRLNALGIFHIAQIAAWTPAQSAWIGAKLSFPGRVERENWVGQAQDLGEKGEG